MVFTITSSTFPTNGQQGMIRRPPTKGPQVDSSTQTTLEQDSTIRDQCHLTSVVVREQRGPITYLDSETGTWPTSFMMVLVLVLVSSLVQGAGTSSTMGAWYGGFTFKKGNKNDCPRMKEGT